MANAVGAWTGGQAIAHGHGLQSAVWAGFALTLAGLVLFVQISRNPTSVDRANEACPV